MAVMTSRARGFPLASRPSMNGYISKLAYYKSPCALIHLISRKLLRQLFKKSFQWTENSVGVLLAKYTDQL